MNPAPPPTPANGSTGPAAVANSRAAAREKADPVHRAGTGILPLGMFFIGAAILLFAGAYVGDLGGGFRTDQFTKLGYVPQPPPGMPLQPAVTDWLNQVHLPRGKKKFALCAACHGTNGHAQTGNEVLAGANKDEMMKKLMDFKSGAKPATIMHQLSKGYTDEQLAAISAWFAAQKK